MQKIVECVPNFSEGRDQQVIDAIADAIRNTEGCWLLDVDPGASTNRTVYTFVGSPDDVVEGALNAAIVAHKLIDMTKHTGEHPRLGAMDVCPFVPVRNVEIEECIYCARKLAASLASALSVPVYLYGSASEATAGNRKHRITVPQIRAGEYEGLKDKLKTDEWKPDFGPAQFVPQWGASMVGVRKFLIAYNINVIGTKEQAHRIALNLREGGRGPTEPGRLKSVQGIGWWLDEANMAQVSLNLTDYDVTPLHVAYEEACKDAKSIGVAIAGSEVVGLVPLRALLQAAGFYEKTEGLMVLEEEQRVRLAVARLGLSALHPFDIKERVLEYRLPSATGPLASKTVDQFVRQVAARTPAPGGGSVAALVGTLGAALSCMVGQMTYGKKQWLSVEGEIRLVLPPIRESVNELTAAIDADTDAFNDYMNALKLPKTTAAEQEARERAMQAGLKKAIAVPLNLAVKINALWKPVMQLARVANIQTKSDLQVGARCMETGVWGAYHNVAINLVDITDETYKTAATERVQRLVEEARAGCQKVLEILDNRN